ncbi:INVS [Bugula neritina]|uniref:INVS n=1 Tax=Bugula neritina TaxID=10212 RepID=A0A7J7KS92_BUGNE|nr:INVS [Bugula neritina]
MLESNRKKKDELSEEERILREAKHKQAIVAAERNRVYFFRQRNNAAVTIQKAWKMFKFRTQGLMKNARDAIKLKRLDAGELEWKKQIAACTIQLAWRKYFRRKLLKALNKTNNAVMHMWDPEMLAFRQRSLVEQVYNEQLYAPHWHPTLVAIVRPYWTKYMPSSAALSFNFAIDQYSQQRDYIEQLGLEIDDDLANLRMKDRSDVNPVHYSYNMN